ncbi:MAG TPA: methyltransferase domain-containing protein [Ktedonobacterales bacterium]|nr:methyltransferase domain-containing protein [Ktedonobacterales bacterium]
MAEHKAYAGYVDSEYLRLAAELAQQDKQRTYAAMRLRPGFHVLDVGCDPGFDTVALARLVGASGQVVGVDHESAMVAEADQRAAEAGVSGRVQHIVADAVALPFEAAQFDACRSERLFQHLADPAAALAEMIRVTRSGGWIVVLETDYATLSIETEEIDLERRLARFTAGRVRIGYAARRLYSLFKRQHLLDVEIEVHPQVFTRYDYVRRGWLDGVEREALAAGSLTEAELARWRASLERLAAENAFFATLNHNLIAGRKP